MKFRLVSHDDPNVWDEYTLQQFNMELKINGFQNNISYSTKPFSGSMLNFGRV